MKLNRIVVAVAALLIFAFAAPARAQQTRTLDISFSDGRVTLVAENVTLREILAEWARKGGSRIINAEKVTGEPVLRTQFENQPEAEVLRTLLREVPGYGASMRDVTEAGASAVEAVFIIATRSAATAGSAMSSTPPSVAAVMDPALFPPTPEAPPRLITGSPDDEIPPVRPIVSDGPPMTPGKTEALDPNLRIGPDGTVSSMKPGVMIPLTPGSTAGPTTTPPAGGRGRGGGGGGGKS